MMGATGPWWWRNDIFFASLLSGARCDRNPSSSPCPAGMSGDCLRGYPQPTPLAPAQVWPGLDLGFLVDFYALGYTKTKGDLPTGLTAAKTITEAGFWVRKTQAFMVLVRHASAVSCGRSRGWNWCGWKADFRRGPVAAVLGPWRARIGHTLIRTPQLIGRARGSPDWQTVGNDAMSA